MKQPGKFTPNQEFLPDELKSSIVKGKGKERDAHAAFLEDFDLESGIYDEEKTYDEEEELDFDEEEYD